jgi:hypothetical protein
MFQILLRKDEINDPVDYHKRVHNEWEKQGYREICWRWGKERLGNYNWSALLSYHMTSLGMFDQSVLRVQEGIEQLTEWDKKVLSWY